MKNSKPSQEKRILQVLLDQHGQYVNGRYFLHTMLISQFHRAIFNLQKEGYNIEPSPFKDEYGFLSYRLLLQQKLF